MSRLLTIAAVILAASNTAAFAIDECVSIDADLDRLACYDKASGRTPKTEVQKSEGGDWLIQPKKSDFEDTTDIYLSVHSNDLMNCNRFGGQEKATLMIRCKENTTAIFLNTNCHLASGHGGYGVIDYRIDDQAAGDRNFEASTDNSALGLWNGGKSIPFIKKMIDSDRVLMRFTPFNQSPTTVEFKTAGLSEAIKPLRKECSW